MDLPNQHLSRVDPRLGVLIKRVGPLKLPKPEHNDLYPALLSAIAHQQLHSNAAQAILGRLKSACGEALPTPTHLLGLTDETLRTCGFSATKMAALRDLAAKAVDGTIPSRTRALRLSDEALIQRLISIRGVGRWTVEMLLIFTLKRPDVFPVDDFGVREGYKILHGLEQQPKPKAFLEIGLAYAPHRTRATLYLWRAADELKKPGTVLNKA